jgi:hypothetical protein
MKNQKNVDTGINKKDNKKLNLIKKFGIWGFIFFLAKGLVWLGIFFGVGSLFV